jgi:Holliday junction DNA helicase RuvA
MQLFGFRSVAEREWHRLLTSVQGVGARAALAIIGALGQAGVSRALATGDVHAIRQAPGVGPKLAQRIVTELRGRAPETILRAGAAGAAAMPGTGGPVPGPEGDSPPAAPAAQMAAPPAETPADCGTGVMAEALSALLNLGYDRGEAAAAVAEAAAEVTGGAAGPAPLIRAALRRLAREL